MNVDALIDFMIGDIGMDDVNAVNFVCISEVNVDLYVLVILSDVVVSMERFLRE